MSTWLKRVLICASFVAGMLALGAGAAYAEEVYPTPTQAPPLIDQTQTASNDNTTNQEADSSATTNQSNSNVAVCAFCVDSNNGDVNQSNDATTESEATNNNSTGQSTDQGQVASIGNDSVPGDPQQQQDAYNGNETNQEADSSATTNQSNSNVAVCAFCVDSNNGDVNQSNDATTESEATNNNATGQAIGQDQAATVTGGEEACCERKDGGDITQSQTGSNDNTTYQKADSTATTNQKNRNASICAFCVGSNNGDVNQSNDAYTGSEAKNNNATGQAIGQNQTASSSGGDACDSCTDGGGISQTQDAYNGNETTQKAYSDATTNQENKNFQLSVFSVGGKDHCQDPCGDGGGDVTQSNKATTTSEAKNNNWTGQAIGQNQTASSTGGEHCPCPPKDDKELPKDMVLYPKDKNTVPKDSLLDGDGWWSDGKDCQCEPKVDTIGWFENGKDGKDGKDCRDCRKECGDGGGIAQTQCAANRNYTYQKARSTATTGQENKNFGFSLFTLGTGNGDVTQSNDAYTRSKAKNNNWTWQAMWQSQEAFLRQEAPEA